MARCPNRTGSYCRAFAKEVLSAYLARCGLNRAGTVNIHQRGSAWRNKIPVDGRYLAGPRRGRRANTLDMRHSLLGGRETNEKEDAGGTTWRRRVSYRTP